MNDLSQDQEKLAQELFKDAHFATLVAAQEYVGSIAKRPDRVRIQQDHELLAKRFDRGGPL